MAVDANVVLLVGIVFCFHGLLSKPSVYDEEGEKCGVDNLGGVCTVVSDCPRAVMDLETKGHHDFQRCGFVGIEEIVCCSNSTENYKNCDCGTVRRSAGYDDRPIWSDSTSIAATTQKTVNKFPLLNISERRCALACKEYAKSVPIQLTQFIIGGENASLGEFPHMVALGYDDDNGGIKYNCGGSLISRKFVLTAAHCIVTTTRKKPIQVRLGIIDLLGANGPVPQDVDVMNIMPHPDYKPRTRHNDIALLELKTLVVEGPVVHPACLYQEDDVPEKLLISGWGVTKVNGEMSNILQKAVIPPVSHNTCNEQFGNRAFKEIITSQICAGDGTGKDTCQGDSGGPLQVEEQINSSIYSIVGVTSYGMGCGGSTPGIYTKVFSYLDWIEDIVWPQS